MTGGAAGTPGGDARPVDLHMHSTASDGALPPDGVVETARAVGLAAIALTDHDTLAGVPAARAAGERLGVRVIAGVELSAYDGEREIHLLALHLSRVAELEESLSRFRDVRERRAEEIVRRLNALGVPVTMESVRVEAKGGAIGRPHVARALVAGGWVPDLRVAFDRWLGNHAPAFVPKHRLAIADAIRLAHDAGGIAVVAHPGSEFTRAHFERLATLGLDGIEVRHPSHTAEDIARLGRWVDELDLVPSGGSDWHGQSWGSRMLGVMRVPHEWLERQDARVAARAGRAA